MQTVRAFAGPLAVLSILLASPRGALIAGVQPTLLYTVRNGYGLAEENRLDTVDAATAEILDSVQITLPGFDVDNVNGLARRPSDGTLFIILRVSTPPVADGNNPDILATLDPATGVATFVGELPSGFAGLAFLPNGALYGVAGDGANSFSETLFEINPANGQVSELFFLGHGEGGEAIAPAPNGRLLHASGDHPTTDGSPSQPQTLEFVNPASGAGTIDVLLSHTFDFASEPHALAWSAQTNTMYISTSDDEIRTISLADGSTTFIATATPHRIKGIAFDGATLYAIDNDSGGVPPNLHTIDLATGEPLTSVAISAGSYSLTGATGLARQPGTGELFAVLRADSDQRLLAVINPATGEADVRGALPDLFAAIAFRPNGTLYGATGDGALDSDALYTINTANAQATLMRHLGHGNDGEAIAFAGDDLYHASGSVPDNQYFERIDLSVALPPRYLQVFAADTHAFPFDNEVLALAWSDTLGKMFVTDRTNQLHTVTLTAPATFTRIGSTDEDDDLKGLAFAGPTCYALLRGDPVFLRTLDPATGATLTEVEVTLDGFKISHATGLARSPINGRLYAILDQNSADRHLVTIDPATGVATDIGNLADKFAGLAFRANGALIGVTGDGANTPESLFTINTATAGSTFLMSLGNGDDGEAIAIAPDGFLYHASGIEPGDQYWEKVNLDTQQVTNIPVPGRSYPWGRPTALATREASPVALVADNRGNLFSIDTVAGTTATIGAFHEGLADGEGPELVMKGMVYADAPCPGDTDGDGDIDFIDLNRVLSAFGFSAGNPNYIPGADLDHDGDVDFIDLNIVLSFFGTAC